MENHKNAKGEKALKHKNITIRAGQDKWITEHSLNLSDFVQKKIDELIMDELILDELTYNELHQYPTKHTT